MGKTKAQAPTLPRIRYMCFDLTHAPVATAARTAAIGLVSMSTRPDPEGSGTVENVRRLLCTYLLIVLVAGTRELANLRSNPLRSA